MNKTLKFLIALIASIVFLSCSDDDVQVAPKPVLIKFDQQELNISESSDPHEIALSFDKAAIREGIVTVTVATEKPDGFTTIPAMVDKKIELPVTSGQTAVKFKLAPVNDELITEKISIRFTIASASDGFMISTENVLAASIEDYEYPAMVDFKSNVGSARENSNENSIVVIALSKAAPANGSVEVSFASTKALYGTDFITEPAATNGKILLPVAAGADQISFKVIPVNDQLYNGDRLTSYTITQVQGALAKGQALLHQLLINDDEVEGKTKGYTVVAGTWTYHRRYEYNYDGLISEIHWESNTTGVNITGSYSYEYNDAGQLVKMLVSDLSEVVYTWKNGKIIKEEEFKNGVLKKYILYGYDGAGNVGEAAVHYRQPDGELKLSLLFVYLYFQDGNIYKQMTYSPVEGPEEYSLISTRTFENYLSVENPFTMVEILPNKDTQPNLPGSYRVEENGHNILYQFSYEFDTDGRPTKRTATSSSASEVAYYEYY